MEFHLEGSAAGIIIFFEMSRTNQTVMALISNMRLVHTYFTIFGTVVLFLCMVMQCTPGNKCNGEYPKH
jgi:hypothetical protein